jgi:adenylate cyclase
VVAAERARSPAARGGQLSDTTTTEGRKRIATLLRRIDENPALLKLFQAARRRLPGDEAYGDPLSLSGEQPSGIIGQQLALVAAERPSVLKEVGFSALQVWQSLSEAQGRGRGDEEVAIVFTDLAGFSTWALDAGDTMAVELLRRVAKCVEPVVAAHGGKVVKRLGDGLMAVFPDPEEAVAAALESRDAVREVEIGGHQPRLRAGVHVGRPRPLGGDYLGVDVNIAARVAEAAKGGEVLVSEAAREQLDETGLRVRRKRRFKGKGTPQGLEVYGVEPEPAS